MNKLKFCIVMIFIILLIPVLGISQTSSNLIDMLPAETEAILHINIGNIFRLPYVDALLQEEGMDDDLEVFKNFDEMIISTVSFDEDVIDNMDEVPLIYLKGDYQPAAVKQNFIDMGEDYEEIFIEGVEGIQVDDTSLLFVSPTIMAITSLEDELRILNIMRNPDSDAAIDKQSGIYKKAKSMKSNIMWVVGDLNFLGEINFGDFGLPIQTRTALELMDFSISLIDNKFDIEANVGMTEEGAAEQIANFMMASVSMFAPLINDDIPDEIAHLKGYITNAINSISIIGANNVLALTISIEMLLVEELIDYALITQEDGEMAGFEEVEEPEWDTEEMDEADIFFDNPPETEETEDYEDEDYEDIVERMAMEAEEISDYMDGGEIFYEDARIEGKFNLYQLGDSNMTSSNEMKAYVDSSVTFINSVFTNDVTAFERTESDISQYTEFNRDVTFVGCTFKGDANFKNVLFKSGAKFIDCLFEGDVNFNEAEFQSAAIFRESVFGTPAKFNNVEFSKSADFNGSLFVWEADFDWSVFGGKADFRNSEFQSDVSFSKAIFKSDAFFSSAVMKLRPNENYEIVSNPAIISGNAYFGLAQFTGGAYFNSVIIGGDAYFRGAKFLTYADFRGATIEGNADFVTVQFAGDAYFVNSLFYGYADFEEVLFNTKAQFEKSRWMGDVSFIEAQFNGYAYFSQAWFEEDVTFEKTQFIGYAYFREVIFDGEAGFINVLFNGKVSFKDAEFNDGADFSGALLNGNPFDPTK